tara:strand:- start:89 stop:316 length:228 start_codon:yes stop_codon:yes gene_type:complete
MARRNLIRPGEEFDQQFLNYLVDQIEDITSLTLTKGERSEYNSNDGSEIVLVSPNGTKYKLEVDNSGSITTTVVT